MVKSFPISILAGFWKDPGLPLRIFTEDEDEDLIFVLADGIWSGEDETKRKRV